MKKNIANLGGALDTRLALRGVSFEYKDPEQAGTRMGFVAQEVERVLPEWVADGADGYKRLTVNGFEALTVEALRELEAENEALRLANAAFMRRDKEQEPRITKLESMQVELASLRAGLALRAETR